jgi:hypothetical protein
MKYLPKLLTFFLILSLSTTAFAQENYTINGSTYNLKTEVEGPLKLLWNVIDNEYRYFAKKDNQIVELTNTRSDGKFQEEYKQTLARLTADNPIDPSKTNLTLVSLRNYFNAYNKSVDASFIEKETSVKLEKRLGLFGGLSNNNNSSNNTEGVFAPLIGLEFEVTDSDVLRRHGFVLQFRHSFEVEDYELTYSQLSFNYRFKFIQNDDFALFAQAKLLALSFYSLDEDNEEGLMLTSGSSLQTPMGLGIGMDIRLGMGYITLAMNDIVAPGYDADETIAADITLGYKFRF